MASTRFENAGYMSSNVMSSNLYLCSYSLLYFHKCQIKTRHDDVYVEDCGLHEVDYEEDCGLHKVDYEDSGLHEFGYIWQCDDWKFLEMF